jgi:hypothetical protein
MNECMKPIYSDMLSYSLSLSLTVGKQHSSLICPDVDLAETRVEPQTDNWFRSFGTIDCGLELMRDAWQRLAHVFSVEQEHTIASSLSVVQYSGPRYALTLLNKHPVEVLVVERGHIHRAHSEPIEERWEILVSRTKEQNRPCIVIETWDASASTWYNGPAGPPSKVRWEALGYSTRMRVINATNVGGAIDQRRLIVTRLQETSKVTDILWNDNESKHKVLGL